MALLIAKVPSNNKPTDAEAWNFICRHLQKAEIKSSGIGNDGYDAELKPEPCESIEALIASLTAKHKLPSAAIDSLHIMLAIVVSLKINGPMLWMHCIGPSSSAKTTLARLIGAAHDRCFTVSKFKGLYSGKAGDTDPGLVPRIQNRVLIIPDLTPLLQADKQLQDTVFGDLRDIYEGVGSAVFNNGVHRSYSNVVFGLITCTTDVIRTFSRSDLGERCLMADTFGNWDDDGRFHPEKVDTSGEGSAYKSVLSSIISGLDVAIDEAPSLDNLASERAKTWGFINHINEWISDESPNLASCAKAFLEDTKYQAEIESLATWLEYARCPMPKKNEEIEFRKRSALLHRSVKQLTKLAICLCIVTKSIGITSLVRRLVRKVAFDTCYGYPLEIMNWLAKHPEYPKSLLAVKTGRSTTYIDRVCDHLQSLGVVQQTLKNNGSGQRGRDAICYSLTPAVRVHADNIGLHATPRGADAIQQKKTFRDISGKTGGDAPTPTPNAKPKNNLFGHRRPNRESA